MILRCLRVGWNLESQWKMQMMSKRQQTRLQEATTVGDGVGKELEKIFEMQESKKGVKKMLDELKQQVYEANMELPAKGSTYTWGNVSGLTENGGLFVTSQVVLGL